MSTTTTGSGLQVCGTIAASTTSSNSGSIVPTDAIRISPVANAAAANILTLTNASMGQATTLTLADPGSATAKIVLNTGAGTNNQTILITAGQAALASAGKVTVWAHTSATAQIAITDIKVVKSTGLSGNAGDRLLTLTDGTIVFNNAGITAAVLGTPITTVWGGTGNPVPASTVALTSTAGADVYLNYSGGTADYNAGSVIILVSYVQVTN